MAMISERHGDVKAIFTRNPFVFSLKAIDNMTELTVVHIDHPFPGNATRIDAQLIAVMDMVVNQRLQGGLAIPMAWKSPVK